MSPFNHIIAFSIGFILFEIFIKGNYAPQLFVTISFLIILLVCNVYREIKEEKS